MDGRRWVRRRLIRVAILAAVIIAIAGFGGHFFPLIPLLFLAMFALRMGAWRCGRRWHRHHYGSWGGDNTGGNA
jgi:hypothetical protein